ncbi:9799_t:CDS:2 [Ambispora leptoticha]|uniref:9799_t:CDS:1 n=1 Tax=Ambispora leptoticha TaxID=144679 RepID=A0A9N8W9R6_9GLOM|nr:9799_t:CDS:2 [Ambispora leptoticha]
MSSQQSKNDLSKQVSGGNPFEDATSKKRFQRIRSPTDSILSPCSAKLQEKKKKTLDKVGKPLFLLSAFAKAAREETNSKPIDESNP